MVGNSKVKAWQPSRDNDNSHLKPQRQILRGSFITNDYDYDYENDNDDETLQTMATYRFWKSYWWLTCDQWVHFKTRCERSQTKLD